MERTMTMEAALVAERNGTVRRIISLEGIAHAALASRKIRRRSKYFKTKS